MLLRVRVGTSENRQDGIADELIDGSIELEYRIGGYGETLIEHFEYVFGVHPGGKICEVSNVGKQERDLRTLPTEL
jgi:hypothetical protein